jgi:two-component system response regulator YesN
MYKVLLVDDEKIILQGISTLVEWDKLGTKLIGTAFNGKQAYEMVQQELPDIIITDIKMPVMNGIELIKRVKASYPKIRFIILSGHEEFDFAKQAMEHEVKYYLLKPCNHHKISDVLTSLVDELMVENKKESYIQNTIHHLEKALPQIKEQFLKELLTNKSYGAKEWDYYRELLNRKGIQNSVKLILLEINKANEYIYLFALKNIVSEIVEQTNSVLLSTTLDGRVVLLIEEQPNDQIIDALKQVQQIFSYYYSFTLTIAISDSGEIAGLRQLYQQTMECLKHRFYYGEGSILTRCDLRSQAVSGEEPQFDHEYLVYALRSGNVLEVEQYTHEFFKQLISKLYDIELVKAYSMEMYIVIIRQAESLEMDEYFKRIILLQSMETLEQVKSFIGEVASEIAHRFYESQLSSQSQIVRRMLQYVNDNIADESISLLKLANEIMYMNADYLGKLFKKDTGFRFTTYIVHTRIELAKKLITSKDDAIILEIAEQIGFGNNPKYFSQVFKKETGYTPSDYKRIHI